MRGFVAIIMEHNHWRKKLSVRGTTGLPYGKMLIIWYEVLTNAKGSLGYPTYPQRS